MKWQSIIAGIALLSLAATSCEFYSAAEQLCEYDRRAQFTIAGLNNLPVIRPGSSPQQVADFGHTGEEEIAELLEDWGDLKPPSTAEVWHESMEEWFTTLRGIFAILTAVEDEPQVLADAAVDSWIELRTGLGFELEQLNRQYSRIFEDCP